MNKKLLQGITTAGLFHDIGKFMERAYAVEPADPDIVQQEYNYAHAFHTEQALKLLFGESVSKRLARSEDEECNILNLASRHHKPRTEFEIIISEADRLASGHDRARADDDFQYETQGRERKSQVPLLSIFSRISLPFIDPQTQVQDRFYRLKTPSIDRSEKSAMLFPCDEANYPASKVRSDYKTHWSAFVNEIKGHNDNHSGLNINDHFETLLEICRLYQWCLPASTRKEEIPDVSLFEHQKATAALSACIFYYHQEQNGMQENAIRDRQTAKYLLFCGDICGVQKFIYQISSKGAYKTLKGRSFYVQLIAKMLAHQYVEKFGLTCANILYVSGEKFYLLLPDTDSVIFELNLTTDAVNKELFDRFNGDMYLRTGYEALTGNDLTRQSGRTLSQIWDNLTRRSVFNDRQRYSNLADKDNFYNKLFGVDETPETRNCEVCHCTMKAYANQPRCSTCLQMEEIGFQLGHADYIVMSENENAISGVPKVFSFSNRHFWFPEDKPLQINGPGGLIWALNNIAVGALAQNQQGLHPVNAAPFFTGGTHRFDQEFEIIAQRSKGIARLGVLRMDVDNLGKLFSEGLRNYQLGNEKEAGRFHSMGRITTLSGQMALFFSGMIPSYIENNDQCQDRVAVVYSGGDDLFLLGAWDALPEVALAIRNQFKAFTCHNPAFSISGGMVMTGGRFPIYKSAEMAGEAEHAAKQKSTCLWENGKKVKQMKNAFTFLDVPMHWREFAAVQTQKDGLINLLNIQKNRPLLPRLRAIAASWEQSKQRLIGRQSQLNSEQIRQNLLAEKWRWLMVYTLARFCEGRSEIKEEIKALQEFILQPVADTNRSGVELLGVLSRWCELLLRKRKTEKEGNDVK